MLITKEVEVKWASGNKEHYQNKYYKYTGLNTIFNVKVKDLMTGTIIKVEALCDNCKITKKSFQYSRYYENIIIKNDGIFICNDCKRKLKYEKELLAILDMCKYLNRIPHDHEINSSDKIGSVRTLSKYVLETYNLNDWKDYFRNLGYKHILDLDINRKYKYADKINYEDLIILFKKFESINNRLPIAADCIIENNLPTWGTINKLLKYEQITLNDFYNSLGKTSHIRANLDNYNIYKKRYINISEELGYPLKSSDLINNNYGLPSSNWFIKYCPNKNIKNFNQFIEWCGFIPRYEVSKELATNFILEKQKIIGNRPLLIYDFKNPNSNEIGIRTIIRIWGSFSDMQDDLNLLKVRGRLEYKSKDELKQDIINLCNEIYYNENRKIITYQDIRDASYTSDPRTYDLSFKEDGLTLRKFINNLGFDFPPSGNGMNYTFEDGEKVISQFEFHFSNYLRNKLILQYNIDYFRDVKYKTFTNCNKNSNCDYVINYKGRKIFIEVVGILKPEKKTTFRIDIYNSKSKEKYRKNLVDKENMFIESGLEYYILFACDLNDEYLETIFNNNINIYKDVS